MVPRGVTTHRRWFAEESIALAAASMRTRAPTPPYDGTAEEHATRTTEAVVAGNPVRRRAAQMMG